MASFKQEKEDLYETVFTELKALGVKVPKIKKFKANVSKQKSALSEEGKIFGANLNKQEWVTNGENTLPKFILMATTYLQKFTDKEGLFRKAGSITRQRRLREKLEKGENLQDSDPNDVACLLKQWLRELPEPLIPYYLQTLFIRCQSLASEKDSVSACLLTCLLLPADHLHSLKHLLRFLLDVASNSKKSRMSTYNLALIMAPNIFGTNDSIDKASLYVNNLVYQHTAIMKILIENCDKIGKIQPSIFLQKSLHRPKSTASLDMFPSSSKSKRKLRNDIITGFRKLVGQNGAAAEKMPCIEENIMENSFPRQAISVTDLNEPSLVESPSLRDVFPASENTNRHIRRKSFGTLLLRLKDKKRTDNRKLKLSVFDKKIAEKQESQGKLELHISKEPTNRKIHFSNLYSSSSNETSFSSMQLSDIKQEDFQLPETEFDFNKLPIENGSNLQNDNVSVSQPCAPSSSNLQDNEQEIKISQMADISKHEILNKKQLYKSMNSNPVNLRRNKSKGSIKTCSHIQKSICNIKCDKNKTTVCEISSSEKNPNEVNFSTDPCDSNRHSHIPHSKLAEENRYSLKQLPPISLGKNDHSASKPKQVNSNSTEISAPQSLDLSFSFLLQNFCLSPPSDSKEIKLSIGITSDKNNPELKVNISQREVSPNQSKVRGISCKASKNTLDGKSRQRLSSNSDSRIPRLKRHSFHRPKSFSGNPPLSIQKISFADISTSHSYISKIPVACVKSEPLTTPIQRKNTNDSCFMTPDSSLSSGSSHTNESNCLTVLCSPEETRSSETSHTNEGNLTIFCSPEETHNKRESIARILKENTGHVKEKVNLYDNKVQNQSNCSSSTKNIFSENGKLLRTASEKYHLRYKDTTSLYSSNKCDSARRGGSLRSKTFKSTLTTPPKFKLTDIDSPMTIFKQK